MFIVVQVTVRLWCRVSSVYDNAGPEPRAPVAESETARVWGGAASCEVSGVRCRLLHREDAAQSQVDIEQIKHQTSNSNTKHLLKFEFFFKLVAVLHQLKIRHIQSVFKKNLIWNQWELQKWPTASISSDGTTQWVAIITIYEIINKILIDINWVVLKFRFFKKCQRLSIAYIVHMSGTD